MLANFPVLSSTLAVEVGLIWQQLWFVPHFAYHTIILSCFKAGWAGGRATKLVLDRLSATTNLWHHGHSSLLAYQLLMLFFFFKKKKRRCLHNLHFWLVLKQRGHFIILWHKIIVTSSKKRSVFGNVFYSFPPWCDRIGSHSGSHRNYHIRKINRKWSRTPRTRIAILVSQSNCVCIQWRYKWCRAVSDILVDSFFVFIYHCNNIWYLEYPFLFLF